MREKRPTKNIMTNICCLYSEFINNLTANRNQAQSEYKHSLTFCVWRYAVIATKSAHRLQIAQQCTTRGRSLPFPQVTSRSVQQCGQAVRNRQTHRQTRMTNIHFASSTTHVKCNQSTINPAVYNITAFGHFPVTHVRLDHPKLNLQSLCSRCFTGRVSCRPTSNVKILTGEANFNLYCSNMVFVSCSKIKTNKKHDTRSLKQKHSD